MNSSKLPRNFLDIADYDESDLRKIFDYGNEARLEQKEGRPLSLPLKGKILAMIFEKPSTRTRISFDAGMQRLGGTTIVLNAQDTQIGRGESIADTARMLSRYVDIVMMRTTSEKRMNELAKFATIPVINGLTDKTHPCQIMADVMTFEDLKGPIRNSKIAWCGDGNNVAASWIHAAVKFGFKLSLACPEDYSVNSEIMEWAEKHQGQIELVRDPQKAVENADCVVTDTWVSMGDEDHNQRIESLTPYQVNSQLLSHAKNDVIFMHCLPVYRGNEVTAEIIDGPQSAVWLEAENRMHAQAGLLRWCLEQ